MGVGGDAHIKFTRRQEGLQLRDSSAVIPGWQTLGHIYIVSTLLKYGF
jgi:hypothetical protein